MTGACFDTAALLRRTARYRFKTNTAKMLFIAFLAAAVIVLFISYSRRSHGKELSKPAKIAILTAFIVMNVGVVIIDGILAD